MSQLSLDITGIVETNFRWNYRQATQAKNLLRSHYPHSLLITTNSDDESKNDYQPGGMCMALNNNIIGALDHHSVDARGLGRWTYSVINTRKKKKTRYYHGISVNE